MMGIPFLIRISWGNAQPCFVFCSKNGHEIAPIASPRLRLQKVQGQGYISTWGLPSGYVKIAIENGHGNSEFSY
jgi:hypothetical protein